MVSYNFSENVRRVLESAQERSAERQHEYIGTEHILIALLHVPDTTSALVVRNLGFDAAAIIRTIDTSVPKGSSKLSAEYMRPYTSRAKKVLELSMEEARDRGHTYVGTEHLLLGLILEERGIAAQMLAQLGVTLDVARAEVLRVLASP